MARQNVGLTFPRRGVYRQDTLGLYTKFPFGFLQKTRRVNSQIEVVVYPQIQPTEEFHEVLPLVSGELESYQRGRGNDLYAIRDYQTNDNSRHVDWKVAQLRLAASEGVRARGRTPGDAGFRSLRECSGQRRQCRRAVRERLPRFATPRLAFYEINSAVMEFRSAGFATPRMGAGEIIHDILRHLAASRP